MVKIEHGGSAPEYLQQAGEDGLKLVRQIVRYNCSIQGITYGLFNDEQRQAAGDLAVGAEKFWRNYFQDFVDLQGKPPFQNTTDFLREEAGKQVLEVVNEGVEGLQKWWQEHFASICKRKSTELLELLELPETVLALDPKVEDSEIISVIGALEKAPGLRFLPGYRRLEWQTQPTAESFKLILGEKWVDGKIWLENQEGRRFFIASTAGASGLEELLRRGQAKIAISEVVSNNLLPETEFTLFDIDGTLKVYDEDGEATTPEMVRARTVTIKKLSQQGIKVGLWSRSKQGTVEWFGKRLEQETGVKINPCLSLDNWPFLTVDEKVWDRYVFKAWGEAEMERHINQSAAKMGLKIDGNLWARRIHDLLADINKPAQKPFVLEAKAPLMAALWLGRDNPGMARKMWDGGVIINDATETLKSALSLGFNFIHVDYIDNLGKVAELV